MAAIAAHSGAAGFATTASGRGLNCPIQLARDVRGDSDAHNSILLAMNPHHPSLRLYALGGRHEGLHAVSPKLSCRITLELLIADAESVPITVGDHDAVY